MADTKPVSLGQAFWLLDYDGSLCPHREQWEVGHYDASELSELLDELAQKSAGLIWNTGRSVDSLRGQCASFLKHQGFFEHGATFWDTNQAYDLIQNGLDKSVIDRVVAWFEPRQEWLRLEFKTHSLRLIPTLARDRSRLLTEFRDSTLGRELAKSERVYLSEGWRALEVVLAEVNKSNAIIEITKRMPAFSRAIPVAVGDDIGDRDIVAKVLSSGGYAYLVGTHCGWMSEVPHRASQVMFLDSPQDLLDHLRKVLQSGVLNVSAIKT